MASSQSAKGKKAAKGNTDHALLLEAQALLHEVIPTHEGVQLGRSVKQTEYASRGVAGKQEPRGAEALPELHAVRSSPAGGRHGQAAAGALQQGGAVL